MQLFLTHSFIGIFGVFCILFALQYITHKRKEYLLFAIYLLVTTIYYILFTLLDAKALFNNNIIWYNTVKECLTTLCIITYVLFTAYYLDVQLYAPTLYKRYKQFNYISGVAICYYILMAILQIPHHQVFYILVLLFAPICIYLICLGYNLKLANSKYIILGSLLLVAGGIASIILSIAFNQNAYWPGQLAMVVNIILFYYTTQKKVIAVQKENMQLKFATLTNLQNERQRISAELHDEVGGGLSSIYLLSELTKNSNNHQKYVERIAVNSKLLVQKMNEIVWALNIKNDSMQGLVAYIRQYVVTTLDELEIQVKANVAENIPNLNVDGKTRRDIFLIVKELINNIVKHSKATVANIYIEANEINLQIVLKDNGIGFTTNNIKINSYGIAGLQQKIERLQGDINWVTNDGTSVQINIPLHNISYKSAIELTESLL